MTQKELNIKLINSTVKGDFNDVKKLISEGADVNTKFDKSAKNFFVGFGNTPLIICPILQDNIYILEFLIKNGANPLIEHNRGENIFDCIKDLIDFNEALIKCYNQSAELFTKSRIQKILIDNYPGCYQELIRINIITDEIREE